MNLFNSEKLTDFYAFSCFIYKYLSNYGEDWILSSISDKIYETSSGSDSYDFISTILFISKILFLDFSYEL